MNDNAAHQAQILDQFTRQAHAFQTSHRTAQGALRLALETAGVQARETVLDAACGPGVLACAFAEVAQHVTGIDITPTMLEQARKLQAEKRLANITWRQGDVTQLPFDDGAFSLVVSRYAFHHVLEPRVVLAEMARVCAGGGRVVVIDSAPAPAHAQTFNAAERMRDPSHTRALTPDALKQLALDVGLKPQRELIYAWEVTVPSLLERSFPLPGDAEKLLELYRGDVGVDRIGMNARYIEGELYVTFPTMILVGGKQ